MFVRVYTCGDSNTSKHWIINRSSWFKVWKSLIWWSCVSAWTWLCGPSGPSSRPWSSSLSSWVWWCWSLCWAEDDPLFITCVCVNLMKVSWPVTEHQWPPTDLWPHSYLSHSKRHFVFGFPERGRLGILSGKRDVFFEVLYIPDSKMLYITLKTLSFERLTQDTHVLYHVLM